MWLRECYSKSLPGFPFNVLQIRQRVSNVQAKGSTCCLLPVERHTLATIPVMLYYYRLVICHSGLHLFTRPCILFSQRRLPKLFSPGIPGNKLPKILYIPSEHAIQTSHFCMSSIIIKSTFGEKRPRTGFQSTAMKLVHLHLHYQGTPPDIEPSIHWAPQQSLDIIQLTQYEAAVTTTSQLH